MDPAHRPRCPRREHDDRAATHLAWGLGVECWHGRDRPGAGARGAGRPGRAWTHLICAALCDLPWYGGPRTGPGQCYRPHNPDFLAWASDGFLQTTIARGRRGTEICSSLRGLGGVRQFTAAEIDDLVAYLRGWQRPQ
jgi:hypothetical protein